MNSSDKDDEIIDVYLDDQTSSDVYETMQRLSNAVNGIVELAGTYQTAIEGFNNIANQIGRMVSEIDISVMLDGFERLRETLVKGLSNVHIPQYSEERKLQLLDSYEQWGKCGWSINPTAPWSQFNKPPESIKAANAVALKYCKNETEIFDKIRKCDRIKVDFDEAIFDFEQRKYKSCALVLFTLIESSLIRTQKDSRNVGKGAINNAENRIESLRINSFYQMLMLANYIACLRKMFEGVKDFKPQPEVINRNFLCHGMLWRPVKRMDCMQLFLVYYNTLQMLETLYS